MIPLANPRANYLAHEGEILHAIRGVLNNGNYISGAQVKEFEKEFAAFIGAKHAIGVNSGTDALTIAMMALGIGQGDEVLTCNTAIATVAAILDVGATPTFDSTNSPHIKAAVPVHLYGEAMRMKIVGIPIIEDCAQACGGFLGRRRLGNIGLFGCFSFYPTKNLGACGDGGMIVTSNDKMAKICRWIREYGWDSQRVPQCIGINSRLDPIQAAILRVKLKYLDQENERRRTIAFHYDELRDLVQVPDRANHCFHLYVIECEERDKLMKHLRERNIQTGVHYPVPIHKTPVYKNFVHGKDTIKSNRILSLPMYPELTDAEVEEVIGGVRSFYCVSGK